MGQVLPSGRTIGIAVRIRNMCTIQGDEMNAVTLGSFLLQESMRETTMMRHHTPGPTDRRRMDYTRRRTLSSGRLSTPLMNAVAHIRRQNPPEHL
jgi:hypothetical protein